MAGCARTPELEVVFMIMQCSRAPGMLVTCWLMIVVMIPAISWTGAFPLRAVTHPASAGALDPAAWGTDHVGRPLPEFVSGDECLFCHRMDIAPTWAENRHRLSMRLAETEPLVVATLKKDPTHGNFASEVDFLLGGGRMIRFLKRTEQYGRLALLSTAWRPTDRKLIGAGGEESKPEWDLESFGNNCAGCHASGFDARTRSFAAVSLDCFTCHGDITLAHSKDSVLATLSRKRRDPARVVASICGQCHIRTGKSRSTGLPYPNQFVAGDNLFRDFQVSWTQKDLDALNPADRHILENVRDVVVKGTDEVTCLTCHDVHGESTVKHRTLPARPICANCHDQGRPGSKVKRYSVHSSVCGY